MKSFKFLFLIITICFVTNTMAQTVYTTKTVEKYHKNNCRYLKYSKKERKLEDVVSLGFTACKVCKPLSQGSDVSNKINPSRKVHSTSASDNKKSSVALQCTGKTKSGARCKRKTKNSSGRCYQH